LKAKMDRGESFVLVDALSTKHYQSSHLPGAVNLPYEFVDEAEKLLPDKDTDISFSKHKKSALGFRAFLTGEGTELELTRV
jgi:rhodanese-related sulfurtransferase